MAKKVHIYIRDEQRFEALKRALGHHSFSSWVEGRIAEWTLWEQTRNVVIRD